MVWHRKNDWEWLQCSILANQGQQQRGQSDGLNGFQIQLLINNFPQLPQTCLMLWDKSRWMWKTGSWWESNPELQYSSGELRPLQTTMSPCNLPGVLAAGGTFSDLCSRIVHEGWWLYGDCSSIVEHRWLKPKTLDSSHGKCQLFTFLYLPSNTSISFFFLSWVLLDLACIDH